MIHKIDELDLKAKKVLIRVDFNCPMNDDGTVRDDTRIKAALKTINYAVDAGARVILMSHLGRPKGEKNKKYTLEGVAVRLSELISKDVIFVEDTVGESVEAVVSNTKPGDIVLLENLRFYKEETNNDPEFSKKLANLCDVYVNDAFGTAHRAHASTAGIAEYVKEKAMGFLLAKEIENLSKVLNEPEHPFVLVLGGAKVSDKIPVIENMLDKADSILVGGAMAYTLQKVRGVDVGDSLVEEERLDLAKETIEKCKAKGVKLYLPLDHVVAPDLNSSKIETTDGVNISSGMKGLDIGPKTIEEFSKVIAEAKMVVWNGPMGVFETPGFDKGTVAVAKAIADSSAYSVVGGGDSVAAVRYAGVFDKISHVSTGGGASLEFLEGKTLPAVKALEV